MGMSLFRARLWQLVSVNIKIHETLGSNWREICPILFISIHYIKLMKHVFATVECFTFP